MKKSLLLFFLSVFLFIGGDSFADTCATSTVSCGSPPATAVLTWNPLTQADINQLRSDCTLYSVTYGVTILGLGSVNTGNQTSYTWSGLSPQTSYQWYASSTYSCAVAGNFWSISTNNFSFTTPNCNQPPNTPLPVGDGEIWDNCSFSGVSIPIFQWTYSDPEGDLQTAYELRIGPNSTFPPTPGSDELTASGGVSTAYTPIVSTWSAYMQWNKNYWWIVRVKDNNNWSAWSVPNIFTTLAHAYPHPDFIVYPIRPALNVSVKLADNSNCYPSGGYCSTTAAASYLWDFGSGSNPATSVKKGDATTTYNTTGSKTVRLTIQDNIGTCYIEKQVTVASALPRWQEVPPIMWLRAFFAQINISLAGLF